MRSEAIEIEGGVDVGFRLTKIAARSGFQSVLETVEFLKAPALPSCLSDDMVRALISPGLSSADVERSLCILSEQRVQLVDSHQGMLAAALADRVDDRSLTNASVICHVDVGASAVRATVFKSGHLVDYAWLEIGSGFISLAGTGVLSAISESGETFLDGVAKQATIGEKLEEEKLELFCMLLGEIIAHFLCDRRPPQLTQRLLASEKLKQEFPVDEYVFSGGIFAYAGLNAPPVLTRPDVGQILQASVLSSMSERGLSFSLSQNPLFATAAGLCRVQIP